jgi:uncharacterized protein YlxP (DUF503 family)
MIAVGIIVVHVQLPGCSSLKEKRGILKHLLDRLNKQFCVSASEIDRQDQWQESIIACAIVSNSQNHNHGILQKVPEFIQSHFPGIDVIDSKIELR